MCVIKHRNRLLRENVDALSLEVFEIGLDRSLKKTDRVEDVPGYCRWFALDDLKDPFPNHFMN